MKRILITGKNSYIGNSVENWLIKESENYKVDKVDMKDESWRDKDFSLYDVVIHVAGIAHIRETYKNQNLYFEVNRDLAYEVACKSKECGVKQFIFLSTMSVYGIDTGVINKYTPTVPKSAYGKSKIQAEELICELKDASFSVSILRPPMVYGKGCKGNYQRLASIAYKIPVFPKIDNKRSMIYIDNLTEFVKQLIDYKSEGLFFPQNAEYVNTSEMVKLIASNYGKKIKVTKIFNPFLYFLKTNIIKKVFGDLTYDMNMSTYSFDYRISDFKKSITETESRV